MKYSLTILFILSTLVLVGCSGGNAITGDVVAPVEEALQEEPEPVVEEVVEPEPEPVVEEPEEEILTVRICADEDKGNNKWVKSTIRGFYNNASGFEFTDYCMNEKLLMEFYCFNGDPMQESHDCRGGCSNAQCQ